MTETEQATIKRLEKVEKAIKALKQTLYSLSTSRRNFEIRHTHNANERLEALEEQIDIIARAYDRL